MCEGRAWSIGETARPAAACGARHEQRLVAQGGYEVAADLAAKNLGELEAGDGLLEGIASRTAASSSVRMRTVGSTAKAARIASACRAFVRST